MHSFIKGVITDGLQRTRTARPACPLSQMEKLRPPKEEMACQDETPRKTGVPPAFRTPQSQGEASHNTSPAEEKKYKREIKSYKQLLMHGPHFNIRNVKNGEGRRRTWDGLNKFMSKGTGYFKPFRNTPSTYPKAHVPITKPASAPCPVMATPPLCRDSGLGNTKPKQPFFPGCLQFQLSLVLTQLCIKETGLGRFVLTFNILIIRTSPKRKAQFFPLKQL